METAGNPLIARVGLDLRPVIDDEMEEMDDLKPKISIRKTTTEKQTET